jgi:uncharacterized protein YqeY
MHFYGGAMRLRDRVNSDLTKAMKTRDATRLSVLRMMKTAIRHREIELRGELEDPQAVQVLLSLIKQRRDSVEQFTKGNRPELAQKEAGEIKVIEEDLPEAVSDDEVAKTVEEVLRETGATSLKDIGRVMKACMARFAGRPVDGNKVSLLVKARLSD